MVPAHDNLDDAKAKHVAIAWAAGAALLVVAVFVASVEDLRHWFVIPVAVCGAMILVDAVDWMRGARDLFDPVGLIGLIGVHFFVLAPLLHVTWHEWMRYVVPPPDWRDWLGYMAILNVVGLLAYRMVVARFDRTGRPAATFRAVDGNWFWPVAGGALLVSGVAQAAVFARFGGVGGYVEAVQSGPDAFQGLGLLFLIAESFAVVAMICAVVWLARSGREVSWWTVGGLLLAFFCLRLMFAGLRGSRSATVYALFWAVGMVHVYLRPMPRRLVPLGLVGVAAFMYVYGFYKAGGVKGMEAFLEGAEARQQFAQKSNRTLETALLLDLGRSDQQAFLLYRLVEYPERYDLAFGRTYLGAASLLVPRQILPERPLSKNEAGTELMYGQGSYLPGKWASSNVYGLAGEAMLNFGPWGVPLAYAALGAVAGFVSRLTRVLRAGDARLLLYPFLANVAVNLVAGDLDNTIVFMVQHGLIPAALIMMGSRSLLARPEVVGGAGADAAVVGAEGPGGVAPLPRRRRWSQAAAEARATGHAP